MKHAMIDLETLGVNPGCVFLSLAAVEFEQVERGLIVTGKEFYRNISLESAMEAGLKIEATTLQWWLLQNTEALKKMFEDTNDLEFVLEAFHEFKQVTGFTHPWGNAARFDLGLLLAGYQAVGKTIPYSPFNEMCFRTFKNNFRTTPPIKDASKAHDPLYDCHYQIEHLNKICKEHELYI